jgi:exosome complex RNA-binding protein Rrp4
MLLRCCLSDKLQPKSGADGASLSVQAETIVFPGDTLSLRGSVVRLGPGLLQSGQEVVASRAGRLKQGSNGSISL